MAYKTKMLYYNSNRMNKQEQHHVAGFGNVNVFCLEEHLINLINLIQILTFVTVGFITTPHDDIKEMLSHS